MKKLLAICFVLVFLCLSMTACGTSSDKEAEILCSECKSAIPETSKFCPSCGTPVGNTVNEAEELVPEADEKVSDKEENEDDSRIYEWDEVCLNSYLPKPESKYGVVQTNSPEDLYMIVEDTSFKEYESYVDTCIDFGYDIDVTDSNGEYEAFSGEKGRLSVEYFSYDKAMHISLEILVSGTYRWHELYFAGLLPAPESKAGDVHNNNDARCDLYVGNISKDGFADYVDKCKKKGFNADSLEYDEYFFAKHAEGYELTVEYYGCDVIYIEIYDPYWEEREALSDGSKADDRPQNTAATVNELELENDLKFVKEIFSCGDIEVLAEKYRDDITSYEDLDIVGSFVGIEGAYEVVCHDDGTIWRVVFRWDEKPEDIDILETIDLATRFLDGEYPVEMMYFKDDELWFDLQ